MGHVQVANSSKSRIEFEVHSFASIEAPQTPASLLDLARRLQSGGNADTVDFAIFRLQQINRHLLQSDRFNEVVHCISAVTVLLESVEEFGTNHGPHATSVPSGAAGRPKFDIPQAEQLQYLIDYEISMTKIAQVLGASKSTIITFTPLDLS